MASFKRFVVLGLGSFGMALATRLSKNGCRVTGVDSDEERVEEIKDDVYEAIVADVTDPDFLSQLSLEQAQCVIISLGESIEPSLLAALHCKELKARRIVVKGVTHEHGRILRKIGVEHVVFPEVDMAHQLADRETWSNVLDFLPIDDRHSLLEIAVPGSLAGKTLQEADIRRRYQISVLGVKDALTGELTINPGPEVRLTDDQLLLVIGPKEALETFREVP
jgi:trk system potassium uptake protein TrkA